MISSDQLLSSWEAKVLRCKLLQGYMGHILSTVTRVPHKYIFVSVDMAEKPLIG